MDIKIFDNLGTKTLIAYEKHSHHIDFVIMDECGSSGDEIIYGDSMNYATESYIKKKVSMMILKKTTLTAS